MKTEEKNSTPIPAGVSESKSRESQIHMPMDEEERKGNPFHTFAEWGSEADRIFDTLR
jgi:hypothetical protein